MSFMQLCRLAIANTSSTSTLFNIIFTIPLTLLLLQHYTPQANAAQLPSRYFYEHAGDEQQQQQSFSLADSSLESSASTNKLRLMRGTTTTEGIPMEFYRELNNITTLADFIEHFVDKDSIDPKLGIQENLKRNVERAAAITPKRANCIPENTIVKLEPLNPSTDPNTSYFPDCTRVKRCGGCCSSALISCQPSETETINFEVTRYQRMSNGKLRLNGKEIIPVEQHTRCLCDCRIKANDCNSYQFYRKDLCRCECKNNDAREKCLSQEHKIWDDDACRCVCHESQSCTTGTVFDEALCKCTDGYNDGSSSIKTSLVDRKRFIVKAIPIHVDNTTLYSF